ncbi:MAG: J domain-containing protein [Phycisphaerae bacterium]|nr:J domain-containing protein [Phycisphaerae bacterium]
MSRRDYYDILGVTQSAAQDEIKRAYRKLAKQYHPDRNAGDKTAEAKFKEVQEAYGALKDPQKRREYDQFGRAGVGQWQQQPHGQKVYSWGGGSRINIDDLEDLFAAFGGGGQGGPGVFSNFFDRMGGMGGGRRRQQATMPQHGTDVEQNLSLSFKQAVLGTTIDLPVPNHAAGQQETVSVKIPPGVENGKRIRLRGRGHPGQNGGPNGDLFLVCTVQPHKHFERHGNDIHIEVPVTLAEAALGAKVDVPTLDGTMTMTLPPGTSGGARLRLRGKGVSRGHTSQRGDQIVIIRVTMPRKLTDEQKQLFENLAKTLDENPRDEWKMEN